VDNRQGPPEWAADGSGVYFTAQERGLVSLYRAPLSGGKPVAVIAERGTVGAISPTTGNRIAYAFTSTADLAELYVRDGASGRPLTTLNTEILKGMPLAETEAFTFISNDNKHDVEAFLVKPLGMTATSKHPLIVSIHGGPHGQQGPAFNFQNQIYAARGWAVLM